MENNEVLEPLPEKINEKKCTFFSLKQRKTFFLLLKKTKKVQEENVDYFFKELSEIKWEKPEEAKKDIQKLLKTIEKK